MNSPVDLVTPWMVQERVFRSSLRIQMVDCFFRFDGISACSFLGNSRVRFGVCFPDVNRDSAELTSCVLLHSLPKGTSNLSYGQLTCDCKKGFACACLFVNSVVVLIDPKSRSVNTLFYRPHFDSLASQRI